MQSPITENRSQLPLGSPYIPEQDDLDVRDVLFNLGRRWRIMAVVAVLVFALVAVATFRQKAIYVALTKVVVASKRTPGIDPVSILEGNFQFGSGSTQTQVEIIKSPELLQKAYDKLSADEKTRGYGNRNSPPSWASTVKVLQDTDIIMISGSAYKPDVAAKFANLIAEEYLQEDLSRNNLSTQQALTYVSKERARTEQALETASQELARFKSETGLVSPTSQVVDIATASGKVASDLSEARATLIAARKKREELARQLTSVPTSVAFQDTTSENPEYAQVRDQVSQLQTKLAEVSQTFRAGSPERAAVEEQLRIARGRLRILDSTKVAQSSRQRNPVLTQLETQLAQALSDVTVAEENVRAKEQEAASLQGEMKLLPAQEQRYILLQQKVAGLTSTFELLSTRYYALLIEIRTILANGQIVARAVPSDAPSQPNIPRNLGLGLLFAMAAGVISGLVANYLDNKMHRVDDVERYSGIANLSLIPEVDGANTPDGNLYIGVATPTHAFLESFRILRNNISFQLTSNGHTCISVTSSAMGEGKSTVAANLAIALAMDRKKVLIIDVDLRRPTVHDKLRVSREVGLSNIIRGLASIDEAVQTTEWEGLYALSTGPLPPDPTEFLNSEASRNVIKEIQKTFDVVILDSPPCIGLSDMQIISTLCDGIVLVVGLDRTTRQQLSSSVRMVQRSGGKLLGTAINRVSAKGRGYYGYGYGYGYGYYGYYGYYGSDEEGGKGKGKKGSKKK